ncbi:hypothetical protein RchiOBHm_Chr2g0098801 [Rosa chinensis]|uniref:Uncharacterized protein n=1 Tax=Rosa chinensis TaxID=74649 RepID=A0A2P6RLR6_ROSCH|nr:hypothetical protein RchiOBHm_Chr2g0098801 [Rosa chinensis]
MILELSEFIGVFQEWSRSRWGRRPIMQAKKTTKCFIRGASPFVSLVFFLFGIK